VSAAAFFDAARSLKRELTGNAAVGLTQSDVDGFNEIINGWSIAVPDDYFPLLAQIESGGRPYVKAPSTSASGLYQFVKATWIGLGGSWGANPALAFGGLKPSTDEQLARAKAFTAKNATYLRAQGVPINSASLYAAHFLGPSTAARVIAADVNARADQLAGEAATSANPSILSGKSVGQFLSWLHDKTGEWAR
jgi:hypothetical protein